MTLWMPGKTNRLPRWWKSDKFQQGIIQFLYIQINPFLISLQLWNINYVLSVGATPASYLEKRKGKHGIHPRNHMDNRVAEKGRLLQWVPGHMSIGLRKS